MHSFEAAEGSHPMRSELSALSAGWLANWLEAVV